MDHCLLLIHSNEKTPITRQEWDRFFTAAQASGTSASGSEIGRMVILGDLHPALSYKHIAGYMRFGSADKQVILDLNALHSLVIHSGLVERGDLPKT